MNNNSTNDVLTYEKKKKLVQKLTCNICEGIYRNAVTINECMHTFCEACLLKSFFTNPPANGDYKCPQCNFKIGTRNNFHEGIIENKMINKLVDMLFPEFIEINKENRIALYRQFHEYNSPLPNESEYLEDTKITVELKPLTTNECKESKLPSFARNIVNVKQTCKIEAVKKYVKNQLVDADGEKCTVDDYHDIELNYMGINQNSDVTLEMIKKMYNIRVNKVVLFYFKKPPSNN